MSTGERARPSGSGGHYGHTARRLPCAGGSTRRFLCAAAIALGLTFTLAWPGLNDAASQPVQFAEGCHPDWWENQLEDRLMADLKALHTRVSPGGVASAYRSMTDLVMAVSSGIGAAGVSHQVNLYRFRYLNELEVPAGLGLDTRELLPVFWRDRFATPQAYLDEGLGWAGSTSGVRIEQRDWTPPGEQGRAYVTAHSGVSGNVVDLNHLAFQRGRWIAQIYGSPGAPLESILGDVVALIDRYEGDLNELYTGLAAGCADGTAVQAGGGARDLSGKGGDDWLSEFLRRLQEEGIPIGVIVGLIAAAGLAVAAAAARVASKAGASKPPQEPAKEAVRPPPPPKPVPHPSLDDLFGPSPPKPADAGPAPPPRPAPPPTPLPAEAYDPAERGPDIAERAADEIGALGRDIVRDVFPTDLTEEMARERAEEESFLGAQGIIKGAAYGAGLEVNQLLNTMQRMGADAASAVGSGVDAVIEQPSILLDKAGQLADAYDDTMAALAGASQRLQNAISDTFFDVLVDPSLIVDAYNSVQSAYGRGMQALAEALTNPENIVSALKILTGAENFANALDGDRSLASRLGQTALGVASLGGTLFGARAVLGGAGAAAAAGEGAAARSAATEATVAIPAAASAPTEAELAQALAARKALEKQIIPIESQSSRIQALDRTRRLEMVESVGDDGIRRVEPRGYVDERGALEQLTDTRSSRTGKQAPDEIKDAIINTREDKLYRPADTATIERVGAKDEVRGMMGDGDRLVMDSFQTPGKSGRSLGADRDARLMIERADGSRVEVPRRLWENDAYSDFYRHTAQLYPEGVTAQSHPGVYQRVEDLQYLKGQGLNDEQVLHRAWADEHNQLFTDRYHVEASLDNSDQWRRGVPGGGVERVQADGPVIQAKAGKAPLRDPGGYSRMWQEKTHFYEHNVPEAFAQSQKGISEMLDVRNGYRMRGMEPPSLPPKIAQAMDIVIRAPTGAAATPEAIAAVDGQLQALGFRNAHDAMTKIAMQNELLIWSRPIR